MEFSWKSLIFSLIILIVVGGAGFIITDPPVSYVILFIAIVLAIVIFRRTTPKKNKKKTAPSQNTVKRQTQQENPQDVLKKSLLKLNIEARVEGIPHLADLETIIDQLIILIPHMKNKFPDKEITWQTEKIATGYLPDILKAFLTLNESKRQEQSDNFKQSLRALLGELKSIEELTSSAQVADFDMKANEISLRFSNLLK